MSNYGTMTINEHVVLLLMLLWWALHEKYIHIKTEMYKLD